VSLARWLHSGATSDAGVGVPTVDDENDWITWTEAEHAWLAEPDVAAGEIFLTVEEGAIRKLVVTFDRGVAWS